MQEYTQPTPSDGADAISYQIPSSVREVIGNYRSAGQSELASLIQEIAETSYLKGQLDTTSENIQKLQRLEVL